jgi:hypothetical protein
MSPSRIAAGLGFVSLLAIVLPAQQVTERCAPGRWYTDGGNASRNATSANAPLLRRPVVAWRQKVAGTITGDPLVWDDHVVVAVRVNDKRAGIEVRRLADGSLVGQPRLFDSTTDPAPALWGNEVIWRVGPGSLQSGRIGRKTFDFGTRMPAAKQVGPPLRVGTRVYAIADGRVVCMRATDFREVWRSADGDFAGSLSIAGDRLYAVRAARGLVFELMALDLQTGAQRATIDPIELTRAPGDDLRMQIAGDTLWLRFGTGHFLARYESKDLAVNAMRVRLPLLLGAAVEPHTMPLPCALDERFHVGTKETGVGKALGLFPSGKETGVRLDAAEVHRPLADALPVLAGDVLYLGACAVGTGDCRMRWCVQTDAGTALPKTRAIPAGRTLLLAGDRELIALREDVPDDPVAAELRSALITAERTRCTPLVDAAIAAGDVELAGDLLARCRELEADEAWASGKEKAIAAKGKEPKLRVDAAKSAATKTAAQGVAAAALDDVHRSLAAWTQRPDYDRRHALRFVLRQAPGHAGATADVRALLAKELGSGPGNGAGSIVPPEPFAAIDWLDFLDATAATKVAFFEARGEDFTDQSFDSITLQHKQHLLEWREKWRPDLKALRSERLIVFSPITQPGSLAKGLAAGELVCDTLEAMFASAPRVRTDPRPMLVFVYPDRDEYLAEAKKVGFESLEWTAGFYSDHLNERVAKSRLFVPSDEAGFLGALPTLAHELTHQWLMDRCPAFQTDPAKVRLMEAPFWIVEGFASLIEQFEFDFARRKAVLGKANLERADVVASAHGTQLLDWNWLVEARRAEFARLQIGNKEINVPSSLLLGSTFKARPVQLYYAQAAMLCRYLYDAEGGRHRAALLAYVIAWYAGKVDELDFAKAFGATAKELAPKVIEYSRTLLN